MNYLGLLIVVAPILCVGEGWSSDFAFNYNAQLHENYQVLNVYLTIMENFLTTFFGVQPTNISNME